MDQELEEVPAVFNNHQTTESLRQWMLDEHEFSDIPMHAIAKKPINWSQASQQQADSSSSPERLSGIELDCIHDSEVVV